MGSAAKLPNAGQTPLCSSGLCHQLGYEIPSEEGQGKDSLPEQDRHRGGQEHLESGFRSRTSIDLLLCPRSIPGDLCCWFAREAVQKHLLDCFLKKKPPKRCIGFACPGLSPDCTLGVRSMQDIRRNYLLYPTLVN